MKQISISGLSNYSDKMSLSQVILFFERLGIVFTKTMIQNYVRIGLLTPLINKRYYGKDHIIFLALISSLKEVYSLEEIKSIFSVLGNKLNGNMAYVYQEYLNLSNLISGNFDTLINEINLNVKQNIKNSNQFSLNETDSQSLELFLFLLIIGELGSKTKNLVIDSILPTQ